jgi:P-type Ca2+ transporter type 2C
VGGRGVPGPCLAERYAEGLPDPIEAAEDGLRLVALVAITDPPRPAAAASVEACRRAGIIPVMITGDHPLASSAIAQRIGSVQHAPSPVVVVRSSTQLER